MIFSTVDSSKIQSVLPVRTMKFDFLKRIGSPVSVIFSIKPKKRSQRLSSMYCQLLIFRKTAGWNLALEGPHRSETFY